MKQYLVQQPKKLEGLAMARLGDWIALQAEKLVSPTTSYILELFQRDGTKAEDLLSRQIEIIRNFLDHNLPCRFHDKLVIEAMRAIRELLHRYEWFSTISWEYNEYSFIVGRMVETLFSKNLTCLSLNNNSEELFLTSFFSKSYLLTNLTRLCIMEQNDDEVIPEEKIIQSIQGLHSLTYLSLNNITDNILKCIAKNCTLIEELNISYSPNINDKSIGIITQLPNLRIVSLNDTTVKKKGIETLLLSCGNIERIGIWTDSIVWAIEHIVTSGEAGKQFNLKSFCMDYSLSFTFKQLQLVVKTCPQIQNMILVKHPRQPLPQSYLIAINDLQYLRVLELKNYDFYSDQVKKILEVRGCNLVNLSLEGVKQMDLNALICIYQNCPNLERLTLELCVFVQTSSLDCVHNVSHIPVLKNLSRLTLHTGKMQPTAEQLVFLLSNCPNVKFILTSNLLWLYDNVMLKILDNNSLKNLNEFIMSKCKLTEAVIDRIIENCISSPEVINYD